jgi:adenylosuccinate lyase
LRKHAADNGQALDEARLDEVCRPERYLDRLADVFGRVAALA